MQALKILKLCGATPDYLRYTRDSCYAYQLIIFVISLTTTVNQTKRLNAVRQSKSTREHESIFLYSVLVITYFEMLDDTKINATTVLLNN